MAYRIMYSLFALLCAFNILLATTSQAAGCNVPKSSNKGVDVKQPEWLIKSDNSVLIPGIGRVIIPPAYRVSPYDPYTGGIGGTGSPPSHIPGGDDTFVPNPGFEVPTPGSSGMHHLLILKHALLL
ncbi:putative cell wall protein [Tripterygium wilfordii]|uniref:Putative cell wall protein n=1 Tax=Tripterygium wilfordii TaxID=458696 RepID=A0A7J7DI04_TRIWF|nr:putative cell wall protein [Tripterygium wilfordii]KAF5745981.1 putative cell wall protein [Tripterygium wilfordii]